MQVDGHALDDLYAEALQCWHMRGVVGQQADLADTEVGEDLAAEADLAQDALGIARRCGSLGSVALAAVEDEASGCGVVYTITALGLVQVDESAATMTSAEWDSPVSSPMPGCVS